MSRLTNKSRNTIKARDAFDLGRQLKASGKKLSIKNCPFAWLGLRAAYFRVGFNGLSFAAAHRKMAHYWGTN